MYFRRHSLSLYHLPQRLSRLAEFRETLFVLSHLIGDYY